MKAIQMQTESKGFEKHGMEFRFYSISCHRNTECDNDKGMQIIL